jgi:hypothetical protein
MASVKEWGCLALCCPLFLPVLLFLTSCQSPAFAQTVDDAVMIPGKTLFSGYLYTRDSWDQYWEGTLKRTNGNLGTVTTQTSTIYADYGVTDKINVIATVPYVWTESSQGVLASQAGWQDITLAAKYKVLSQKVPYLGRINLFAVGFWGTPMTNYTPDFQPLSIGLDSRKAGARATLNFALKGGFYLTGSGAYTWQGDVTLDRPYYFTNNQLFLNSVVEMPGVVSYSISPGYLNKNRMLQFTYSKLITQGGNDVGDIRRQDFPFVANRFIAARIGGVGMYPVPFVPGLVFRFEYSHVIDGRNVGQSNTFTTGLLQTVSFKKRVKKP